MSSATQQLASLSLYDMHCHPTFAPNGVEIAIQAARGGNQLFANTINPADYRWGCMMFEHDANVHVGLGLHPWWIDSDWRKQLELFDENLTGCELVGEVGLDFSPRRIGNGIKDAQDSSESPIERQVAVFQHICSSVSVKGAKLMSVHSVKAATQVMDVLQHTGAIDAVTCIFHWFSGSSDELQRAIHMGCYFSVNFKMAATKRGLEYIKAIPVERLLLETDLPANVGDACAFDEQYAALSEAADAMMAQKGTDALHTISQTSQRLLK